MESSSLCDFDPGNSSSRDPCPPILQSSIQRAKSLSIRSEVSLHRISTRRYSSSLLTFRSLLDDPQWIHTTIHKHPKGNFVNFENFEDYLRPQERLCTPSPNNKTVILSFPLDPLHYNAAQQAWAGKKNLIFMGHDPSCFAPHEQRSSFK